MIKYKDLPKEFQNESVKKYYEIVSKKRLSLVFKRIFDIIFSVLTLIILLIPIFIISIAIKLDSKGSVFYRQERVTRYGKKFNIFLGDMSFVGTRPEVTKYVERYSDYMYATLLLPAGLTSYSSINYKDEDEIISKHLDDNISVDDIYIKYILPDKMKYNIEYIERFSFWYDIKIMFKTFLSVFLGGKNNEG